MAIIIPGLDVEKGLDLYDDDEEIYTTILRSYATNIPSTLDKIRTVSAETLKDYAVKVHGIKGISANIGAEAIRGKAKELEALANAGDLGSVLVRNEAFLKEADTLVENINAWLKVNAP